MRILPLEISEIKSRSHCDTSLEGFDLPLILSPMSFYTHECIEKINNRFVYILPRISPYLKPEYNYENIDTRIKIANEYFSKGFRFGASVGLSDEYSKILDLSKYVSFICVDIANGYSLNGLELVRKLSNDLKDTTVQIITGNIGNFFGLNECIKYGADLVRYGIGGGKNCSTSLQTPIGSDGFNSLHKIFEEMSTKIVEENQYLYKDCIIYDGGIKSGNDFSYALLNCKWVMVSSIFGGTELNVHFNDKWDVNGNPIRINKKDNKKEVMNYGMASKYAKSHGEFIEGFENWIPKANFEDVVKSLKQSLQSSMSYLNSSTLDKYKNAKYEIQ